MVEKGYDPTCELLVIANDIDPFCVYMTYVQLTIYKIPGMIRVMDTLLNTCSEVFYTPNLYLNNFEEQKEQEEQELQ